MSKLRIEFGAFAAPFKKQLANQGLTCTDTDIVKLARLQRNARCVYYMLVEKLVTHSEAAKIEGRIVKAIAEIVGEPK